jgi:hypothetical protein
MSDGHVRSSSDIDPASPANPRPGITRRAFIGGTGAVGTLAALGVTPWGTKPASGQTPPPSAGPQSYIGKQSMNPQGWPNTAPGWSNTTITPLSPSGGFSPVRLTTNNGTSSTPYPGFTEPVSVGDHITYRIKVAPGLNPGGVRVNYLASGSTTAAAYCLDLTVANPVWSNIAAGTTLVSSAKLADGTTEAVFRTVVQNPTLQIGVSTATDTDGKQVDIWGLQVVRGDLEPWQPVGNTSVAFGPVAGVGLDFIGKQSMNPQGWPNTAPGWSNTTISPLSPSGGFSPVRLTTNNGTSSTPYPGFTEPFSAGDPILYRIKVAPGLNPGGVRVNYLAAGSTTAAAYCLDLTVANPVWNNIAAGTTLVSSTRLADGTTEAVFRTVVQDPTLRIGVSTATDTNGKQVDIWGLQVVRGDREWQPVGGTTVASGSVSSVDLDFVAGSYQGGSLADLGLAGAASYELNDDGTTTYFNANVVRRTDLGVWVHGEGAVYIGKNSQTPASWTPNPDAGWANIVVTPSSGDADGFSPNPVVLQNDNGLGWLTAGLAPDVPIQAGDALTVKFRVKAKTAPGARIFVTQTGANEQWSSDLSGANPKWVSNISYTQYSPYSTLLGSTKDPATGWVEVTIRFIVKSSDIAFHLSTLGDIAHGQVVIGGFQVARGYSDRPWMATATSPVSVAADDLEVAAGSALESLLLGAQGFCGLELQALAHSTLGTIGWTGSTQGTLLRVGTQDVLKPLGPTGFQTLSGEGALGLSGWRGIVRIAIAWDANGYSVFANGSKLSAGGAGVFSPAGTVKLLAGVTGRLRRISAGASRLADADLQGWTQLQNKTFTRPQNALVVGSVTQTFHDDYDGALTDSLRSQSVRSFPYTSWQALAASYDSGGPNAKWMPRYQFYTNDPTGMGANGAINGEPQYFIDPREPGNWTGSHVVQSSCMELHMRLTSQLTASERAKLPNNAATGQPFQYVAGCMTTYGFFRQTFGVFSSRDQMPAFQGSFPAWWLYDANGSKGEFDIEEYRGISKNNSTDTMHDSSTPPEGDHPAGYTGYDAGYDLSADFHDRTCVWNANKLDKYLDGELVGHHVPSAEVNGSQMFLLYDFALTPGDVNGSTVSALAASPDPAIRIDRTTVLQFA